MLEAILFDMDGVLFDTETLYLLVGKPVLEEMGCTNPEAVMMQTIGVSGQGTREIFRNAYGDLFDAAYFLPRCAELVRQHIAENGVPVKTGAAQLLACLRRQNFKMAIASSSRTETIQRLVESAGFSDFFDQMVGCDQVLHAKPAPDLYLTAAERLGVSAQRCLAIEDSPLGTRSALAAGCTTIIVPDHISPPPELRAKAHAVLESLLEVPPVVAALCR